ncbi:hypothetical protein [Seonamhaeicola maritimus]|uniref:hypothetical protein n=1 Tax=Seonamhaeicola maritimus TaxID=2591822 RepID=UPI002494C49F|nr:hypothetical protein [Seonamhaeicola maritimus]
MAPIKFEEHVKEKLEKRRLQPSENAWDKLSGQLETDEKRNNKNVYWWYGIAASIVGILFVITQFLNNGTQDVIENQVVENPKIIDEVEPEKSRADLKSEIKSIPEAIVSTENNGELNSAKKELPKQKANPVVKTAPIVVAENIAEPEEVKAIKETTEILEDKLTFEEQKIQQVVAQVQKLKENKKHVTDAEIEDLLQQAQREITLKQLYNESTGIVDANALLQDVEADLDRSFRDRVFKALRESYGTVKTAVATRNE